MRTSCTEPQATTKVTLQKPPKYVWFFFPAFDILSYNDLKQHKCVRKAIKNEMQMLIASMCEIGIFGGSQVFG